MTILSGNEERWLEPPAPKESTIICNECGCDLYEGDKVLKMAVNEIYCENCVTKYLMEYLREEDFEHDN